MPGPARSGPRRLRAVQTRKVARYRVRITVPRLGGWREWGDSRGDFEQRLANLESPAVVTAEIESETRRGRDYVRVTVTAAVDAVGVAEALTAAWDAFRQSAGDDEAGWDMNAASAEVRPDSCSRRAGARSVPSRQRCYAFPSAFVHLELYRPQRRRRPDHEVRPSNDNPISLVQTRQLAGKQPRVTNRRSTSVATITGQRASSVLPRRDTPIIAEAISARSHADETAQSARSAWRSVMPSLAGTPHVRTSKDGGRTYPARWAGPLPAEPPLQPCTVAVYHPAAVPAGCWPWTSIPAA